MKTAALLLSYRTQLSVCQLNPCKISQFTYFDNNQVGARTRSGYCFEIVLGAGTKAVFSEKLCREQGTLLLQNDI